MILDFVLFASFVVNCYFASFAFFAANQFDHGRRQRRPSRWMNSSASLGPHEPAS